ncbi:hypothetical protein MHBO_005026 [Bonamia ostreae]|uniref:Uncharacterized protein n=1 Tax=Bonamia ostreae TaxID=126728 RepID=A0ABV2AVT6_9EUKA
MEDSGKTQNRHFESKPVTNISVPYVFQPFLVIQPARDHRHSFNLVRLRLRTVLLQRRLGRGKQRVQRSKSDRRHFSVAGDPDFPNGAIHSTASDRLELGVRRRGHLPRFYAFPQLSHRRRRPQVFSPDVAI